MTDALGYIEILAENNGGDRYGAAQFVMGQVQMVLDQEREAHIEKLRQAVDAGHAAETELAELGVPLKPRAPRADKGTKRKPKGQTQGVSE